MKEDITFFKLCDLNASVLASRVLTAISNIEYGLTWGYYVNESDYEKEIKSLRDLRGQKTLVVCGFPGIGKTHLFNNVDFKILDSDSSTFDKDNFPKNYIDHIKVNLDKVKIILVSSHKDVREELIKEGIKFVLIHPYPSLKDSYIERYKERGSSERFINLISENWDSWMVEMIKDDRLCSLLLKDGEYLSDVLLPVKIRKL